MNHLGQPIGAPLPVWTKPARPARVTLTGRHCTVRPLDPGGDAAALWAAFQLDADGRGWTYLVDGPFGAFAEFAAWLTRQAHADDPLFFTIATADGAAGLAAYLRIAPDAGSIEVGHIHISPLAQRGSASTEAMYLMMRHVFDLGYRRYEWKCDALNAPSRNAAERLGFIFEGVFRQALVYKGRNRDTAWYSITDVEWPSLQRAYEHWLAPSNFDHHGRQRVRLAAYIDASRRSCPGA